MDTTRVGDPLDRLDGPARVTGRARYAAEYPRESLLHGVLVQSAVPKGRVHRIDAATAARYPGVRLVLTHENMPHLEPLPENMVGEGKPMESRQPLQDDQVHYYGQHVAFVVADTLEQAQEAAARLRVEIKPEEAKLEFGYDDSQAVAPEKYNGNEPLQATHGDVDAALRDAPARVERFYTTPTETHNPMEPGSTIAYWTGDELTVHESTRNLKGQQNAVAKAFSMPAEKVHLVCPYVGGAFGSKGFIFPHLMIVAAAARMVNRPVKLMMTRKQMFTSLGHRPRTIQRMALGAAHDGRLLATRHDTINETSPLNSFIEHCGLTTELFYASETRGVGHRNVAVNLPSPIFMRAPGEAPGPFALESALDELAEELGIDPVELRLRNDTMTDPKTGKPWSLRNFRACCERGRERFGWARRNPKPRSMREGHELVGYGFAGVAYRANRSSATIHARMTPDGTVDMRTAAHDVGPGTATVMTQVAADELGLPVTKVRFEIGDSRFPPSPVAGGSQTAATVSEAVVATCRALGTAAARRAIADAKSPLYGAPEGDVVLRGGRLARRDDPETGETLADLLGRANQAAIELDGHAEPPPSEKEGHAFHSWGAVFAEVRVDEDLGQFRVPRIVGVYDVGRILNHQLADSQLKGGMIWAIGMAMQEHTVIDPKLGIYVNPNFAEYHIPVNLDTGELHVDFLDVPDPHFGVLGAHGIGEVGIAGTPAAIANAVYHATGKRVRDLPITLDKLL